ncbi:MAG: hypothetical protein NT034_01735 [Candidatus Magasanikbacteria bacterium]|nr:hypothetical protein [Candidatus Magasanikbacteria bacterium]
MDYGYGETWFDNAHNIIMNTLAVQGAFGLISYVGFFVAAICSLILAYRQNKIDYHFMIIGGAFLVAHFVNKITVFEDATSYLYLMFWLALINSMTNVSPVIFGNTNSSKEIFSEKKIGAGVISIVAVTASLVVFIFNIQNATANQKNLLAIRSISTDASGDLTLVKDALAFNSPHVDDIRSNIASSVANTVSNNWQKMDKNKANEILNLTIENLEKNLQLHPLDIRNQLSLSQLYQLQAMINNNASYLLKAEMTLEDALSKSPRRQQIIYTMSGVKVQLNKPDEAIKLVESAIEDNPRISESYWRLAYIYKMMGKDDKALEILKLAEKNGIKFSDKEREIINQFILSPINKSNKK